MVTRRRSALAVVAVLTACGVWSGVLAAPASASRGAGQPTIVTTLTTKVTTDVRTLDGVGVNAMVCKSHDWYYRIFIVNGPTLFRWTFQSTYCFEPNRNWIYFTETDSVVLRDPSIQGSTVDPRIFAPNGLTGSISLRVIGAEFKYCPGGVCRQTFQPQLIWLYGLDDSRTYVGNVPLEQPGQ